MMTGQLRPATAASLVGGLLVCARAALGQPAPTPPEPCAPGVIVVFRFTPSPDVMKAHREDYDRRAFDEFWQRLLARLDSKQLLLLRSYVLQPSAATRSRVETELDAQSKGDLANLAFAIEKDRLPVSRSDLINSLDQATSLRANSRKRSEAQ